MTSTLKGIANIMKQKALKNKQKEDAPHERTAQNILKGRNIPKKNASKEAKNMLNSLSSTLKRQTNENLNSLSPDKTNSLASFFQGTLGGNITTPIKSHNN